MHAQLVAAVSAAALTAAASVLSPGPQATAPPFVPAQKGAHCWDGGGRAVGDAAGKGYIRQELQIVAYTDRHVVGYIYASSDGNDYIDLRPSVKTERVRLVRDGDLPVAGAMMRYCFSAPFTAPWGFTPGAAR